MSQIKALGICPEFFLNPSLFREKTEKERYPSALPSPVNEGEHYFHYFFVQRGPSYSFSEKETLIQKMMHICWQIFSGVIKLGLYVINPSIFTLGFVAGIIWNDSYYALERVGLVLRRQPWYAQILTIAGGAMALPVTVATTSFLLAADMGSRYFLEAQGP